MRDKGTRKQATLITLTTAGATAVAMVIPAPAFAVHEAPGNILITQLMCNDSEDWDVDQPYLKYVNGATIWGPGSLSDGQSANPNVSVNVGDTIELWEQDGIDPDDQLATIPVRAGAFLVGEGSGAAYTITFTPAR